MCYTTIYHSVRKSLGISCNEYCVADIISNLSSESSPVAGWCIASRGWIGDELDLTRQSVIKIIEALVKKNLVVVSPLSHLQTTELWDKSHEGCKESLQGVKKVYRVSNNFTPDEGEGCKESLQGVNNVDSGCKESLQEGCKDSLQGGVKKVDTTITDYNNTSNNYKNNIKNIRGFALFFAKRSKLFKGKKLISLEEYYKLNEKEKRKKRESIAKSPKEYTLTTKLKAVVDAYSQSYVWSAKDMAAMKQIGDKMRVAVQKRREADNDATPVTDDDVVNAFTVMLNRMEELPVFYQFKDVPALNGNFNAILEQLRKPQTDTKRRAAIKQQQAVEFANEIDQLIELKRTYGGFD